VQWVLLTDRTGDVPLRIRHALGDDLVIVYIEHKEWPFPTLLRYQHILDASPKIKYSNFVYLDADMQIVSKNFVRVIIETLNENSLVLVRHPGYFREAGLMRTCFYFRNPKYLIRDCLIAARFGALGTWETNRKSKAYVTRRKRKTYVCGGIWFGKLDAVFEMCTQLRDSVDEDLRSDFIAKFHDESHLNYFNAHRELLRATPAFCFDPTYPQLAKVSPFVVAVDKSKVRA
jgi:hypothetical protein